MNMLLAEIQPVQWVLLVVIILLVLCYPIFIVFRNKKEQEKATKLTNSLKVGKDILTSSGVYGTVVDIKDGENGKIVTIETGTDGYKSYLAIDVLAVYAVLNPDPEVAPVPEETKVVENEEQPVVEEEKTEEPATVLNGEEVKPKKDKKSKK